MFLSCRSKYLEACDSDAYPDSPGGNIASTSGYGTDTMDVDSDVEEAPNTTERMVGVYVTLRMRLLCEVVR